MNILLLGNGAREHALAEALLRSKQEVQLFSFINAKNPAVTKLSQDYHIGKLTDIDAVKFFAKKHPIDFAIIGPEAPLEVGVVDALEEMGIPCIGPKKELAKLETSKSFTRDLLKKYNIPGNPLFKVFTEEKDIKEFMDELENNFVVKADGLCGGKGVKLMGSDFETSEQALAYAKECIEKHGKVVVEEKLEGQEFSLMSFTDGKNIKDMIPVQDHKRAFVDDKGPNTGGMGSYSCADHSLPFLTKKDLEKAHHITEQVAEAIKKETGQDYKGILYGGFMLTKTGVKLIEYNARFGDPEAMNVLPLLKTDFMEICQAIINQTLDQVSVEFEPKASVCKYVVPQGYPTDPVKTKLTINDFKNNSLCYYAALDEKEDGIYMTGSRALALTGIHEDIEIAQQQVEEDIKAIKGDVFHRKDIGTSVLIQKRIDHMKQIRGESVKESKTRPKKLNLAVLASTNGTDMQALIDEQENNNLSVNFKLVICNKECGALEKAKKHNIPYELILSKGKKREAFDQEVTEILKKEDIDLVLLVGYMRILSKEFVDTWKNKIMNIHPSLLPAFAGGMDLDVHEEVLKRGCTVTGCTLHFVDHGVDTGPIILQQMVHISANETKESLKQKVQRAEQEIILKALDFFAQGKIAVEEDKVLLGTEKQDQEMIELDQDHIITTMEMSDTILYDFLTKQGLTLSVGEVRLIENKIKRNPTLTELHIFDIEWSEHCSYKSSKQVLKSLPTEAPHVILGPQEDAGIVYFTTYQGQRYGIVFAHESHNHPSQVVPFEGAATGIGGIVRDVLCMGAKLIGTADPLRFGSLQGPHSNRTKYIVTSVIDGIATYGNAIGIPNLAGDMYFHESFNDNCLVNVICLGLVKEDEIIHSAVPPNAEGYDVIAVGKATDSSGFGGATFASVVLDEEDSNKGAVQVPDPFLKNILIRSTYKVFEEVRRDNINVGFKDCGAGGIMCASSELGSAGGYGMRVDINKIHTSMKLPPYIIACAETQERFVWVVPPTFTQRVLEIYNKEFDLPGVALKARASVIGKVIKEKNYIMEYNGKVVCHLPIDEVTSGIQYKRQLRKPDKPILQEPSIKEPSDYNQALLKVLQHPNIASKAKAFKHYDTEVLGNAIIRPGEADAGVINPIPNHPAGVALATDHNHLYSRINPYHGAVHAVAEAMSNVVAVGATPYAMTDCLCFGNPEDPVVFHDFVESVKGLRDAATQIGFKENPEHPVPFISGNVSFYNESKNKKAIDPSPIVACVGVMQDVSKAITMGIKKEKSILILVGERKDELGCSVYHQLHGELGGDIPMVDFTFHKSMLYAIIDAINDRLLLSCHDISEGGLGVALSEMLIASRKTSATKSLGIRLNLKSPLRPDHYLFSETKGMLVEIEEDKLSAFEACCKDYNLSFEEIGKITADEKFTLVYNGKEIIDVHKKSLAEAYNTALHGALQ